MRDRRSVGQKAHEGCVQLLSGALIAFMGFVLLLVSLSGGWHTPRTGTPAGTFSHVFIGLVAGGVMLIGLWMIRRAGRR